MTANMLVNSRFPMPWIAWKREYSITVEANGYIPDQTLAHGLSFAPLLLGQWSTSSMFNPSYDLMVTVPGGSTGGQPETVCSVSADSANIHFTIVNNSGRRTFYFRLMAFAPPNYKGEVAPVEYNSNFRFNSRYRYQQIYMSGQTSGAVSHNLGYLPQAKLWTIVSGRVTPAAGILTTNTLACAMQNTNYYYYIYKDQLDGSD